MKKKIAASFLAILMITSATVPAFAAEQAGISKINSGIHILWENTNRINSTLSFTGNRADCFANVDAKSGTEKIVITLLLKQVKGNRSKTVKSWTKSVSGGTLYFDKSYHVESGYTYELELNAKVYRNGTVENVSVTDRGFC